MKLAKRILEAKASEKDQRASAIARFFAGWKEADLKSLLDDVEGNAKSKFKVSQIVKDIRDQVTGQTAFGLNDVANGIKQQLGK